MRFPNFCTPWKIIPISNLLQFQNGINGSPEQYGKGVKFISVGDILNNIYITYDNIKEVPEAHYDITPPGRFLDIVDSWNSIVELKRRAKSPDFILPTHAPEMIELVESGKILGV